MAALDLQYSMQAFSAVVSGGYSSCGVWASHCGGFPCWIPWALWHVGFSNCGTQALEHRFSSWWNMGLVAPQNVEFFQIRNQTCVPCVDRGILHPWTTSKVPVYLFLCNFNATFITITLWVVLISRTEILPFYFFKIRLVFHELLFHLIWMMCLLNLEFLLKSDLVMYCHKMNYSIT